MLCYDTKVFRTNYAAFAKPELQDIIAHQGGTYSSKTFSSMLSLMEGARNGLVKGKVDIVGQTIQHLKEGVMFDSETIDSQAGYFEDWNKTDRVGIIKDARFKFLSVDKLGKAKGAKRQYLFINECNEIPYPIIKQLILRTDILVILDWNPSAKFWFHEKIVPYPEEYRLLFRRTTYKDNPTLSEKKIREIESLKETDPELWKVYGLGQNGAITGLVFPNVYYVDEFPREADRIGYGLDFGFTNSYTALVKMGVLHGNLYGEEIIYEQGLLNGDINRLMIERGVDYDEPIIADSAEPKTIEELKRYGWNVTAAKKGKGSITYTTSLIKRYKLYLTKGSVNWRKEQGKYKYRVDKSGEAMNEPIKKFDHCWDAARYYASEGLELEDLIDENRSVVI